MLKSMTVNDYYWTKIISSIQKKDIELYPPLRIGGSRKFSFCFVLMIPIYIYFISTHWTVSIRYNGTIIKRKARDLHIFKTP